MALTKKHQLVTHDGELHEDALTEYLDSLGAKEWNRRYQVVAIMGPQSSGKSTLLNHVFGEEGSDVFLCRFCGFFFFF